MNLHFDSNQCIVIENTDDFDKIYQFLRSSKNGISLTEYIEKNGYPKFPIYLEYAGNSIGYRSSPFCTWTGKPLEILTLNEAIF